MLPIIEYMKSVIVIIILNLMFIVSFAGKEDATKATRSTASSTQDSLSFLN